MTTKFNTVLMVLLSIQVVGACHTSCYCEEAEMTCSKVKMSENDLMGLEIPADIDRLKLSQNGIKKISAEILYRFRHLKQLEISRNELTEISEGTFREFTSLEKLVLNENKIEKITERSFTGLNKLNYLALEKNMIPSLEKGVFQELTRIHTIRLQDNRLESIPNEVFSTLSNLRDLFVSGNEIKTLGDKAFHHMQMNKLSLAKNKISVIPHTAFTGFHITGRVVFLDNPIDCSCKYAMNFVVNLKRLQKQIWAYCKKPYGVDVNIFKAHEKLDCSMCDLNPCKNGGKCTGNKTQFKCNCVERYKGQYCEINICSAYKPTITNGKPNKEGLKHEKNEQKQQNFNHTEYVIVKEQVSNPDDEKKLKILYAMCSFEFIVIICFVVYFMWKRYEEWKLQKQYEHEKSRAILFSIRNQTNAKLAKALCEENEEFPFDIKNMLLKGSVPV